MGAVIRVPIAVLGALALTGSMFWFLHTMISGPVGSIDLKPPLKIDFTPQRKDTIVQQKQDKPERPKVTQVPKMPSMTVASTADVSTGVMMTQPTVERGDFGRLSVSGGSDRDVIPLVRINPEFPRRAAARGIEGWVQLEFTITPAGTVENARVIDADPKGQFEDAALKAIARWKYNPKVVDGKPVARNGIQVVLRFELDKQ
jgi:protein TonB